MIDTLVFGIARVGSFGYASKVRELFYWDSVREFLSNFNVALRAYNNAIARIVSSVRDLLDCIPSIFDHFVFIVTVKCSSTHSTFTALPNPNNSYNSPMECHYDSSP